jgi:hypothetical protein
MDDCRHSQPEIQHLQHWGLLIKPDGVFGGVLSLFVILAPC